MAAKLSMQIRIANKKVKKVVKNTIKTMLNKSVVIDTK